MSAATTQYAPSGVVGGMVTPAVALVTAALARGHMMGAWQRQGPDGRWAKSTCSYCDFELTAVRASGTVILCDNALFHPCLYRSEGAFA